ncbi:MAG: methyl-accepting chemotaxis protein, partial [Deltaproteobacteria bacterium]|nr:methyl-accepting chemotaxis protein [Deltaproteobacteria bacterium]
RRLYDMCPVIKTIAKKLNIVALHISMESSRSRECEEMFNFFVQEIKQLAEKVHEISIKIRDDSERAKKNQVADFSSITDKKEILSSLADNAHSSVEDNVHHMEDLIKMALKTMRRAEIHSQKISSLISEVVVAIQFHDISRQQIDHIVETLEEIETSFNDKSGEQKSGEDLVASLVKTYTVLSLQVEQLNQVTKEIQDAHKKIQRSFHEIAHEVDSLVNGMIGFSENTDGLTYAGNPFEQLISGLVQLDKIINQGKEMAGMINYNLKQSSETAENLSAHLTDMEDISMDLHIKAINALIMSKRLGVEGKTLSILAEDVTEVSLDSNEFVLDVVEILKAIGDLSADMSCVSVNEDSSPDVNTKDQENLSGSIDMISEVYGDFIEKSKMSVEQSKNLRKKILHLESELDFLDKMETTLSSQQASLKKIMENITPFITKENILSDDYKTLQERYTMEVERGIHNKTLKKGPSHLQKHEGKNTKNINTPEEEYLGDNIDLF